jgi:RHS repeat-associated protein
MPTSMQAVKELKSKKRREATIHDHSEADAYSFQGTRRRVDTSLDYHVARWYDPKIGNWISRDSGGFAMGDANLYRAMGNALTDGIDPSGLDQQPEQLSMPTPILPLQEWIQNFSSLFGNFAPVLTPYPAIKGTLPLGPGNSVGGSLGYTGSGYQALINGSFQYSQGGVQLGAAGNLTVTQPTGSAPSASSSGYFHGGYQMGNVSLATTVGTQGVSGSAAISYPLWQNSAAFGASGSQLTPHGISTFGVGGLNLSLPGSMAFQLYVAGNAPSFHIFGMSGQIGTQYGIAFITPWVGFYLYRGIPIQGAMPIIGQNFPVSPTNPNGGRGAFPGSLGGTRR